MFLNIVLEKKGTNKFLKNAAINYLVYKNQNNDKVISESDEHYILDELPI